MTKSNEVLQNKGLINPLNQPNFIMKKKKKGSLTAQNSKDLLLPLCARDFLRFI